MQTESQGHTHTHTHTYLLGFIPVLVRTYLNTDTQNGSFPALLSYYLLAVQIKINDGCLVTVLKENPVHVICTNSL